GESVCPLTPKAFLLRGRWIGKAKTDEVESEFDLIFPSIKPKTRTPHQSPPGDSFPSRGSLYEEF
ncbi:MAG: hypothetical protein IIW08_11425, partial [Clostridia bacterium]|nr:hypothetical protein [Clostridia bacterium]